MSLDYKEICQVTKKAVNVLKNEDVPLTDKEKDRISFYIEDIETRIAEMAKTGKNKFLYDCSKLSKKVFIELAVQFKNKNPLFFVVQDYGIQMLTVKWAETNEV